MGDRIGLSWGIDLSRSGAQLVGRAPDDPQLGQRAQSERAQRLMDLLGLSEDELCQTLAVDPLTLLSGQLDHKGELPILLDLLDQASERAGHRRAPRDGCGRPGPRTADRRAHGARLRRVRGRAR